MNLNLEKICVVKGNLVTEKSPTKFINCLGVSFNYGVDLYLYLNLKKNMVLKDGPSKKTMVIKDGFVMEKVGPKRIVKSVTFGVLFVYRYRYRLET